MREDFEDKTFELKRAVDEQEEMFETTASGLLLEQSLDTLRPGFSWIAHVQRLHPGYEIVGFDSIPFLTPAPALSEACVALVSTCGVYLEGQKPFSVTPEAVTDDLYQQKFREMGDSSFRLIPAGADPGEFWVAHPYLDHRGMEEDVNVLFPVTRIRQLEEENFIAAVARHHLSFMGYLPHVFDVESCFEEAVGVLKEDGVNVAVLTPGEALSHQSMALLQRLLEEAGIATVGVTLCRDITEQVGVPRAVHVRFPFGYSLGEPNDEALQLRILKDALRRIEASDVPGTILDLPYQWVEA